MARELLTLNPEILKYILAEILDEPIYGEIYKVLIQNGFFNHLNVLNMSSEDMDTLTYTNESNEEVHITSEQHKRIQDLQAYIAFMRRGEIPKSHAEISSNITPSSQSLSYKEITQSQHGAIFIHIIVNILNDSIGGEVAQVPQHEKIIKYADMTCMPISHIEEFPLTAEDKTNLYTIWSYLCSCKIDTMDILSIDSEEFNTYYDAEYPNDHDLFTDTPSPITLKTTSSITSDTPSTIALDTTFPNISDMSPPTTQSMPSLIITSTHTTKSSPTTVHDTKRELNEDFLLEKIE